MNRPHSSRQGGRCFLSQCLQLVKLPLQMPTLISGRLQILQTFNLLVQLGHPRRNLLQTLHARLQPLSPQTEFFQQCHAAATTFLQTLLYRSAILSRQSPGLQQLVVLTVPPTHVRNRCQIDRHPPQNLLLLKAFRHRHLDCAVKGQLAAMHPLQCFMAVIQSILCGQQCAAKTTPSHLDLLRQKDLFLAGEQWNLTHLTQIHPNRILRTTTLVVNSDFLLAFLPHHKRNRRRSHLGVRYQLNVQLFQADDQVVQMHRIGRLVRQIGIHLRKRQLAVLQTGFDQRSQTFIKTTHCFNSE